MSNFDHLQTAGVPTHRPRPWAEFRAELLELYKPPLRAAGSRRAIERILDRLEALDVATTADLTVPLITRFVASLPADYSPWTVAHWLRLVRVACNYAVATGSLGRSPFAARPVASWVRCGRPKVRPHQTREELGRLLALMARDVEELRGWARWRARRLYALTALVAYTGLRRNEALWLRVEDLDLGRRVLIPADHEGRRLKTSASCRPVPIPPALVPILEDWLRYRLDRPPGFFANAAERAAAPARTPWLFPNVTLTAAWHDGCPGTTPLQCLQRVAKRAGIPNVTFHSLRRSLATHLEALGVGQAMITRCLRHTNERTTRAWYQDADIPNMTRAVEDLRF